MTKDKIALLLKEVVFPFEKQILNDEVLAKFIEDENVRQRHNLSIAKLSVALLGDIKIAMQYLEDAVVIHKDWDIPTETMQIYLSIYFKLLIQWIEKNLPNYNSVEYIIPYFENFLIKKYNTEAQSEDSFFMFDEEEVDEAIDSMHYEDEEKITALEYIGYGEILEDEIVELEEELHTIINNIHQHDMLDQEGLELFITHISILSDKLYDTNEFKDLGYAILNLCHELNEINIEILGTQTTKMLYLLLQQTIVDFETWFENIFIKQDALDIHYFDASFFANITQIGLILKQQESEDEDDNEDDFLF